MFRRIAASAALVAAFVWGAAGEAAAQWRSEESSGYGAAARRETTFRLGLGTAFFIHGAVSEDATDPPDYSEAFGPAFSAFAELESRVAREFGLHAGVGYIHHFGDTDNNVYYDDWALVPLYVGVTLFPNLSASRGTEGYARLDVGAALSQPVDVEIDIPPFGSVSGDFYESSTLFYFHLALGAHYRLPASRARISFEVGYRLMTGPEIKNSSDEGEVSGAFTVLLGLGFVL